MLTETLVYGYKKKTKNTPRAATLSEYNWATGVSFYSTAKQIYVILNWSRTQLRSDFMLHIVQAVRVKLSSVALCGCAFLFHCKNKKWSADKTMPKWHGFRCIIDNRSLLTSVTNTCISWGDFTIKATLCFTRWTLLMCSSSGRMFALALTVT